MSTLPGRSSEVFAGEVGAVAPVERFDPSHYFLDPTSFSSEGLWAFCCFDSAEIPALRLGFQRGGFNGGPGERVPSPHFLQLHLEPITAAGAILWLPSGTYDACAVRVARGTMDIVLEHEGQRIFRLHGWPTVECEFRSSDGELEARLTFDFRFGVVLPDCHLPHCLFGMWEAVTRVAGTVRVAGRTVPVSGRAFVDHTRVIPKRQAVAMRTRYLYTTLHLEDGSGLFGYHSFDVAGHPIDDYCFGVFIDPDGRGIYATDVVLTRLRRDTDSVGAAWAFQWSAPEFLLAADVEVGEGSAAILKCWGAADAPQTRRELSILPLVLRGTVTVSSGPRTTVLKANGLAEYFDAGLWPADKAALSSS
ncbi:MAG TPA: hypothetical protein VHB68_00075 [Steroidobacteraceae bacterium]|nr:hypothetical protein [Steroidobacteraceae bacterium]